ncbi:MAG: DUF192 domain-containing protein [Planctomycetes bacterium]|nr:DUF192 domain-containing protein [Planctomycetota bacterium]
MPLIVLEDGTHALLANDLRSRLFGLAYLDPLQAGVRLLIPRCRSVHTFGMRFALDVTFLAHDDQPLRVVRGVPAGRVLWCTRATAVLEQPCA